MLPLARIKVVDFCHAIAGPCCTSLLADMGADVIKVESTAGDYTRYAQNGAVFLNLNRNKRDIALDLRSEKGLEVALKLAAKSDVLVENFAPGTLGKLGLSYDAVSKANAKIIYCSISGFGHSGPYQNRPAVDPLIQAMSGIMSCTGEAGQPPVRTGSPMIDFGTGMMAAYSIVLALLNREKTGIGQKIDTALFDTAVYYMGNFITDFSITGKVPTPLGSGSSLFVPCQVFQTRDKFVFIGVYEDNMWQNFCRVLDLVELAENPRYATNDKRCENRGELIRILSEALRQYGSADLLPKLEAIGVICGPLFNVEEVITDSQVKDRQMVVDVDYPYTGSIKIARTPVRFSDEVPTIKTNPPLLGEHTNQIMKEIGYSDAEIEQLIEEGIVFQYPI